MLTHDPGFTSTSSCESAISFIDGAEGTLLHRGYAIADLAKHCSFPEVHPRSRRVASHTAAPFCLGWLDCFGRLDQGLNCCEGVGF
eukprot:1781676-Pleurochrysis_carterae.AAC.2